MARAGQADKFDQARAGVFLEKADIALADERLRSLRDTDDASLGIDAGLLGRALEGLGLAGATPVRNALQGTFHRLFEVKGSRGSQLLRVAALPGEHWAALMSLEARIAAMLAPAGIPLPTCEAGEVVTSGEVRGVQLVERIEGTRLADLDGDEARMTSVLVWVARFLRTLHRIPARGSGPLSLAAMEQTPPRLEGVHAHWDDYVCLRLEDHLRDCEAAGALTPAEAKLARKRFEDARELLRTQASALLHGDPGSHNVIVSERAIRAVIDWEDALAGDPLFDVASLCTFHPERRHPTILAGYGVSLVARGETWERFWLYFLRIALAKTVHRRRFGYADAPGRAPASQRIQLALAKLEEGRA